MNGTNSVVKFHAKLTFHDGANSIPVKQLSISFTPIRLAPLGFPSVLQGLGRLLDALRFQFHGDFFRGDQLIGFSGWFIVQLIDSRSRTSHWIEVNRFDSHIASQSLVDE